MAAAGAGTAHKSAPIIYIVFGVLILVLSLGFTIFQIETNEAFVLGRQAGGYVAMLDVLKQIPEFFGGGLSAAGAVAFEVGYGVEAIFIMLVMLYEAAHDGVMHMSPKLAPLFRFGMYVVAGYDFWTDVHFNVLSSIAAQIGFAIVAFLMVAFGPTAGVASIVKGIKEW